MKFKIEIDMNSAAFKNRGCDEIAKILNNLAEIMDYGAQEFGAIIDSNGNVVGVYRFVNDNE